MVRHPPGEQWASKSSAHRWLKRWYEDGTLEKLKGRILALAEEKGMIDWKYGAVDGSFFPGKGGGEGVAYGYKGKGILIHSITDTNGMPVVAITTPANGDERQQVLTMLAQIRITTGKRAILSVALKLLLLTKDTMPDGCAKDSVLRVFDRRSNNGSSEAKSPRADQSRKLYLATSRSALSPGFNASTDDLLFDGNA